MALTNSDEKLHGYWGSNMRNKAWEGCSPRVQPQGRLNDGGDAGKPRVDGGGFWLHGEVSGERGLGEPEGLGRTEGCPELLMTRPNSPRQRAWRRLDNDRRMSVKPRRAAAELPGVRAV